ncbi:MAG: J domain-containing protein [Methyloceanibacter sp.]|nr:J domain-containing protein [Methyloceanibacter sp.]
MRPNRNAGDIRTRKSSAVVRLDIRAEFRRWGMSPDEYEIYPKEPDGGAMIDFWRAGKKQTIKCRKSREWAQNLFALWAVIESLRLAQQRGILDELITAGLAMLPAGAAMRDPYEVLGVRPDAPMDVIEAAYRVRAKTLHPDTGGDHEEMKVLNDSMERVKQDRGLQ